MIRQSSGLLRPGSGALHPRTGRKRRLQVFFGTFRKNIECQDPGDLRTRIDEGPKWVQEHFAPWAKSFLETRQQSPRRRKEMTHATNQAD